MIKILVSSCLMGEEVRYNAKAIPFDTTPLEELVTGGRVVHFCAEVSGGLPTPRPPAEIQGSDGRAVLEGRSQVRTFQGIDITQNFITGAHKTLEFAQKNNVGVAILTDRSPSCGSSVIHDGTFSARLVPGMGVTASLLSENGIRVFSQHQVGQALEYISKIDKANG